MYTIAAVIVAFVAGYVVCLMRGKIYGWLQRRAAANKLTAAQKLLDEAAAAAKALENAKAVVAAANTMPTPPPNPAPKV